MVKFTPTLFFSESLSKDSVITGSDQNLGGYALSRKSKGESKTLIEPAASDPAKIAFFVSCITLYAFRSSLSPFAIGGRLSDDNLSLDDIRRMAAEIGLSRLTDGQLQELLRATRTARARRAALPFADLVPADEPAHVFRLEPDR